MNRAAGATGQTAVGLVLVAWFVTSVYYFYQYMIRSAPAVMVPEMSAGLGMTAAGVAGVIGLFYYAYAPFSLVAGVAMDQLGPRRVVPIGAATLAIGALLFSTGDPTLASLGRFVQGAGGVFALIGAVYLATTYLPAARAATLIGLTQMFGMAGGSAGQFLVGPAIAKGLPWNGFWFGMGVVGLVIGAALLLLLPKASPAKQDGDWLKGAARAMAVVVRN